MNIFLDIDNTICTKEAGEGYEQSKPVLARIAHANDLYEKGHRITYWTARGKASGKNYEDLTRQQLAAWNVKYHELRFDKPAYDLYVDDKSQNSEAYFQNMRQSQDRVSRPVKVPKGWGYELVITNTPKYCGKIMHFRTGGRFSMHFHILKTETWYVASGRFEFRYIDTSNAGHHSRILTVGDVITNEIGQPHQIICLEEGDVFEVSTQHFDSDSYRVAPGDSQMGELRSPKPPSTQEPLRSAHPKPPSSCPCDLPNGLFLGHLGLGDQLLLAPAMAAVAAKCNTLYVICKNIYESTLRSLLADVENIVFVPIPNITDFSQEVAAINKAVAALPQPLVSYRCGHFHPSPQPLVDFPLCFYKDLDVAWPQPFTVPVTERSKFLASMLTGIPYIFVHDVSSTRTIDLNATLRSAGYLIINPERNAYQPDELQYKIAEQFIRTSNNLDILDYKTTIEGAAQIHLIGSSFFCFSAMLECKATLKVVYSRHGERCMSLTGNTWIYNDL